MNMGGFEAARMPHAILIPFPGQGHVNPMMQLAWKLVSDGFLISFVNTEFNHQRIMQAKKSGKSSGHDNCNDMIRMISVAVPENGASRSDKEEDEHKFTCIKLMRSLENNMFPRVVEKLIEEINKEEEEHKVSCIIADVNMCLGLQEVANLHRISLAAFHTALASNCALRYFSYRLVSQGLLHSDGTPIEKDKMVTFLPCMPPLYSGELPWLYGGEYRFRAGIRMGETIQEIKWILFNSLYELEAPVVDELSKEIGAYPIGPLIPPEFLEEERRKTNTNKVLPSFWADEKHCLEWLDNQSNQSVIYVSFGSIAVWSERQVEEFALGLEASQKPFLWVLRLDQLNKVALPPGFLERNNERGCIVSWAPQLSVLSHPSVACFVTHCGWNSVQESMSMGVPMLCCPYFTDQFLNRTYVVDVWKVGLPLTTDKNGIIDQVELGKAIDKLLVEEGGVNIRNEVRKWKKIAREAIKEGGSSSHNYNLFVNAMKEELMV